MATENITSFASFTASGNIADQPGATLKRSPKKKKFNLDGELMSVTAAGADENTTRAGYRKAAMVATQGVGAFQMRLSEGLWEILPKATTGRVPEQNDLSNEELQEQFGKIAGSLELQVISLESINGLPAVVAPIPTINGQVELFLLVLAEKQSVAKALRVVHKVRASHNLWMRAVASSEAVWQTESLASTMELVARVSAATSINSACESVCNELARHTNCSNVAIGLWVKGKLRLKSISGVHKVDKGSNTSGDFLQTLQESCQRAEFGVYPSREPDKNFMLLSHRQLGSKIHCESVASQPLFNEDGTCIGAWVFTGETRTLQDPKFQRFVEAAGPHMSSALSLLQRSEKGKIRSALSFVRKQTGWMVRLLVPAFIIGFCLLMMMPVTYKVRCICMVEPQFRRFAVAPFEGLIVSGFAEPGDTVKKGEVLAEIDGQTIRWELSGVAAERRQAARQREIDLYERKVSDVLLSELETERLGAEENILLYKEDHLQIRSPIDGVVLSGTLERAEAASVTTGQILFEIGPLDEVKLQVAIPANEISQVQPGHEITLWIEGQEDEPLKSEITSIHPRSEIRDSKNVFVAEIGFRNPDGRLRPGMKGNVRIDCEQRSLAWCLFHKPMNYLRSRLTWW